MNLPHPRKPLRAAAVCVVVGLVIEALTLFGTHPMAFISFLVFGGFLTGAGVLLYLTSLVSGWLGDAGGG